MLLVRQRNGLSNLFWNFCHAFIEADRSLWKYHKIRCCAAVSFSTSCVMRSPVVAELTSVRYPNLSRGAFSEITNADMDFFKELLPNPGQILTTDDGLDAYNTDWMHIYKGNGKLVLRPKSTADVSGILKYCSNRNLAVVPQGGNTGLVGGSVPIFDEIIISMQLMNKVLTFDSVAGILTCEAGCVLETLDEKLAKDSFMMPLDLGSKGSCQIGGNVSTNAGGIRLLRYGSLHGSVLGLEVVLANGEIINCLTGSRKDNTGYHLKHLFIGSEGTLGIVSAVSILCPRRPSTVNVAFLACENFDSVVRLLSTARQHLNEILSAFEFLDNDAMLASTGHLQLSNPLKTAPFYVLVETSGSSAEHDEQKLQSFVEAAMSSELVIDGTIATEPSKIKTLWSIRESVAVGLLDDGYCYKYDISLPLSDYYRIVDIMRPRLAEITTRICGYGHVGDGNIHFNVTSKQYNPEVVRRIEPFLFEFVSSSHGSISAEHGLGLSKNKYITYSQSAEAVDLMQLLKRTLDPKGILNPYKTLPYVKH